MYWLQWVHGLLTVGDEEREAIWKKLWELQWVHGLLTVGDKKLLHGQVLPMIKLQWVHGLLTVGDVRTSAPVAPQPQASMGPRPSDRGRRAFTRLERGNG